jgi:hypothetical protein
MIVFAFIIIDIGLWFTYLKMKGDTLQEPLIKGGMFNIGD